MRGKEEEDEGEARSRRGRRKREKKNEYLWKRKEGISRKRRGMETLLIKKKLLIRGK